LIDESSNDSLKEPGGPCRFRSFFYDQLFRLFNKHAMAWMKKLSILIVDDEPNIRKTLSYCLKAEGHEVVAVGNAADAETEAKRRSFDLAFVDLRLGAEDGMDLIPRLLSDSPWIKIVVITAYATVESAVEAMRCGAEDYIPKPFTPDQVRLLTRRIGRVRRLETEIAALKADQEGRSPAMRLQSANAAMQRVIKTARKAAASEAIILLQGESGTGKSALARTIHHWSPRAARPMATVSCPAVPPELLESELFGHVKGAFTGAVRDASPSARAEPSFWMKSGISPRRCRPSCCGSSRTGNLNASATRRPEKRMFGCSQRPMPISKSG
jgi:DNA-binding NtrC family response regulator